MAPFALATAAGTFLHIAEVDLIPTIVATDRPRGRRVEAVVAFASGVAVVVVATLS